MASAGVNSNGGSGTTVDATLLTALVATAGTFLFLIVIAGGVFIHYSKSATVKARAREVVDGSVGVEEAEDVNSSSNNSSSRRHESSGISLTTIQSSSIATVEK
jgi:hypothetical protein